MSALDTFTSQRTFRVLLDALARPGTVGELPSDAHADHAVPACLAVPLALADLGQSVAVVGTDARRWAALVRAATGCRITEPEAADQVVVLDGADGALVQRLRRGTPMAPEGGCRLVLACTDLTSGPVHVTLRGPGIPDARELHVGGIDAAALAALAAINAAFPAGIDTFLVTRAGHITGIPRSSRATVRTLDAATDAAADARDGTAGAR